MNIFRGNYLNSESWKMKALCIDLVSFAVLLVIFYSFALVPVKRVLYLKTQLLVLYHLEQYSKTRND